MNTSFINIVWYDIDEDSCNYCVLMLSKISMCSIIKIDIIIYGSTLCNYYYASDYIISKLSWNSWNLSRAAPPLNLHNKLSKCKLLCPIINLTNLPSPLPSTLSHHSKPLSPCIPTTTSIKRSAPKWKK